MKITSLLVKYLVLIPIIILMLVWMLFRATYWYQVSQLPTNKKSPYNSIPSTMTQLKLYSLSDTQKNDMQKISPEEVAYLFFIKKKTFEQINKLAYQGVILMREQNIEKEYSDIQTLTSISWMSNNWTATDVATLSLNTDYFGDCCKGITDAADFYFDKRINELSEKEQEILVLMSNGEKIDKEYTEYFASSFFAENGHRL